MEKPDSICGHCGNKYKNHYFEDQIYCYDNTNGDLWNDEPSCCMIYDMIEEYYPEIIEKMTKLWRRENGHGND